MSHKWFPHLPTRLQAGLGIMLTGVILALASQGCHKDPSVTIWCDGELIASPNPLVIQGDSPVVQMYLATSPPGEANWRVTNTPSWLTLEPSAGVISEDIISVTARADTTGLGPGTHIGEIEILSTCGVERVAVALQVASPPVSTARHDRILP